MTQDKLIVEEEAAEAEPDPAPEVAGPEGETAQTPLSQEEYRLLQCLLYGRDYGWVRASGLMLSVLVDSINEKLFDEFADSVLTLDNGPELIEDYIQDLKRGCAHEDTEKESPKLCSTPSKAASCRGLGPLYCRWTKGRN